MDTLFTLHDKLLDMSEMVNDLYALQIVAFITVAFVIILFGFFFETKVIISVLYDSDVINHYTPKCVKLFFSVAIFSHLNGKLKQVLIYVY